MPQSANSFEVFSLNKQLIQAVEVSGFTEPTPIQAKAIPLILNGHDLIGVAQTGTGKTAAYLLPILMKVKYAQGMDPRALVLVPTRELAVQVEEQAKALAQFTDLRILAVYGGVGMKAQEEAISAGVDVLIATPGRFLDLYKALNFPTKPIRYLVLDEADRMLDMGFRHQINSIVEVIPGKKQKMLFSATFAASVKEMAEAFTDFPEYVEVSPSATRVETVTQWGYEVPNLRTKIALLAHLLEDRETFYRVIVFTKTKKVANNVFKYLERTLEEEVRVIHANKAQSTRLNAIEQFKSGEIRVLVATDVAARGIDASMVSHVINFEVPVKHEEYIHRIGRTGRAQQTGDAITFIDPAERYHLEKIEELMREKLPLRPVPKAVPSFETPREEKQEMARQIDWQRRKEDPTFKGAFHEKKPKSAKKGKHKKGRNR